MAYNIWEEYIMANFHNVYPVVTNLFLFIALSYSFCIFVFFSFFFVKMRKVIYFFLIICLHSNVGWHPFFVFFCGVSGLYVKELQVGNYYICNLKDYANETCTVNYDYNKMIKLLCPINKSYEEYDDRYCFKFIGIRDRLVINNQEEPIMDTLPGIIIENLNMFDRYNVGIYMPFYVKEDITIVCTCESSKDNEAITPYLKIHVKANNSFNKEGEFIKGCDYGNNKGKHQFLTNTLKQEENFLCEINANPGEVVGMNCINFEEYTTTTTINNKKKKHQNKNNKNNFDVIQLRPPHCFSNVSISMSFLRVVTMNVNNLLPEAKYYPEVYSFPKDKKFQKYSTISYLWIPENVPHDILFYCHCNFPQGKGIGLFNINKTVES